MHKAKPKHLLDYTVLASYQEKPHIRYNKKSKIFEAICPIHTEPKTLWKLGSYCLTLTHTTKFKKES